MKLKIQLIALLAVTGSCSRPLFQRPYKPVTGSWTITKILEGNSLPSKNTIVFRKAAVVCFGENGWFTYLQKDSNSTRGKRMLSPGTITNTYINGVNAKAAYDQDDHGYTVTQHSANAYYLERSVPQRPAAVVNRFEITLLTSDKIRIRNTENNISFALARSGTQTAIVNEIFYYD